MAGLTRAVLNRGGVDAADSGGVAASASCVIAGAGSARLREGGAGSVARASGRALDGHCSCDLAGMAPVFLNQHLRPSISRHEYQPVFGSPAALMQSIAQAAELTKQQQANAMPAMLTRLTAAAAAFLRFMCLFPSASSLNKHRIAASLRIGFWQIFTAR